MTARQTDTAAPRPGASLARVHRELVFDRFDLTGIGVRRKGKRAGTAVPPRGRHADALGGPQPRAARQSGSHLLDGWVRLRPLTTRKVSSSGSDASGIVMPAAFPARR